MEEYEQMASDVCIACQHCRYPHAIQARSQSDNGDRFSQILDFFQGLKIEVPSGCLGKPQF